MNFKRFANYKAYLLIFNSNYWLAKLSKLQYKYAVHSSAIEPERELKLREKLMTIHLTLKIQSDTEQWQCE